MLNLRILRQAIGELDEAEVLNQLNYLLASEPSKKAAQEAVVACQQGMSIVGDLFEKGKYFIGDLIFAGELLSKVIRILKPVLVCETSSMTNLILLGTVRGDLHDIGKNIFKSMAEAAGFSVIDLGIDVASETFVKKAKEFKPSIIGMSGILTLSIDTMKVTVDTLKAADIDAKIIIGGHPVNAETCLHVGADGYTINAAEGVSICQKWMWHISESFFLEDLSPTNFICRE